MTEHKEKLEVAIFPSVCFRLHFLQMVDLTIFYKLVMCHSLLVNSVTSCWTIGKLAQIFPKVDQNVNATLIPLKVVIFKTAK